VKKSVRILTSLECNYNCSYCCNYLSGMRETFKPLLPGEVRSTVQNYDNLVISGGEPLIDENIENTLALAEMGRLLGKKVIVYTNLSLLPPPRLIELVDGWTVGFHVEETDLFTFGARFLHLEKLAGEGKSLRVNTNMDLGETEILANMIGEEKVHTYQLNDCDRSDIEDIYLLTEEEAL